jgi:hypothetical protein
MGLTPLQGTFHLKGSLSLFSRMKYRTLLCLWLSLAAFNLILRSQSIEDIGSFLPTDLSADGSVIVGGTPSTNRKAVRWENGTLTELWDGIAYGVSDDGSVVVGWGYDPEQGIFSMRWENGVVSRIDPPWDQVESGANTVSGDGTTIFGFASAPNNQNRTSCFRLKNGTYTEFSPERITGVGATNEDGTVFGGQTGVSEIEDIRAVIFTPSGHQIIGSAASNVVDISSDGSFALVSDFFDGTSLYNISTGIKTPVMSGSSGMTGDGAILVGTENYGAVLWTAEKGTRSFVQAFQEDYGVDASGKEASQLLVSSDGSVFVGTTSSTWSSGSTWILDLNSVKPLDLTLELFDDGEDQELIEDAIVEMNQQVTARLTVTAKSDLESILENVAFVDEDGLLLPEQLEVLEAPESLAIGDLAPGETIAFEWSLEAVTSGLFTLETSSFSGLLEGEAFEQNGAELEGEVPGLIVEIVLPEEDLQLVEQEAGENLNEDPGYEPLAFDVIVRVSVPENAKPLENITFQGFDASDGGLDIDLVEKTGLEDPGIADVLQQPVPFPISVKERAEKGFYEGPLLPGGDPIDFKVTVEATRPGLYDFAALITAAPEALGRTITARGNAVKQLLGEIFMTLQLEVVNDPASVIEGEAVEISGFVENITFDETIQLDPLIVVNKGQGIPRGPVALDDPLPPVGFPGIYNPLLTPDDEGKRSQFRVRVETVSLPGINQEILGRPSVLIDFAIGGIITDKDGNERELKLENIAVEWGNGRHETGGVTLLRCAVEPDPKPVEVLDPDTFFTIAAGNALENFAIGGGEGLIGIGQFLASLPSGLLSLANFGGQVQAEKQIAAHNLSRWMWAWLDYQTDVWLNLESETHRQQLQLITDELIFYYGPKFETAQQITDAANNGVRDYMLKLIDYRERAYDASSYGYNDELAKIIAEPFRPLGAILSEEAVSSLAVLAWVGRASRSARVLEEVSTSRRLAREEALEIADEATSKIARRGEAGDPRATFYQDPRKAIPRSTPINQKQAIEGWAVDKVSDDNLIRMTKVSEGGMPIFVAIRSRADETLQWMKTKLGITPKPMTFKPKNVNRIDVDWLGYRDGVGYGPPNGSRAGDRGATALAEPLPRDVVEQKLNSRGADSKLREKVLERHNLRWKEWYGADWPNSNPAKSKFQELVRGMTPTVENGREVLKGTLDVPKRGTVPQPDANFDTTGPGQLDARKFELREALDIPDNDAALFPEGRKYYECWLEDDLGTPGVRTGTMRRIAGDIDIVSVGYADGSALKAGEAADTIAKNLQHAIYAQHPWSSSFEIEELFKEFLDAHRWNKNIEKRGEPLLVYVNGERRVAWFHPTRAIDAKNPLQGMVWLDGGTADVNNVVQFQRDLRGTLPDPYESNPPSVKPTTTAVREALLKEDAVNETNLVATCVVGVSPSAGRLFRLGQNDELEERENDGSWSPVDPSSMCTNGSILTLPETHTAVAAEKGSHEFTVLETLLGFNWKDLFAVGTEVLIAPGTDKESVHTVVGHGSLILEPALQFDYPMGTRIVALPNPHAPSLEPFAIEDVYQEILPDGQARVNVLFRSLFHRTLMMEASNNLVDWQPVDPVELLGANFSDEGFRVGNAGEEAQFSLMIDPARTEPLFIRLRPVVSEF